MLKRNFDGNDFSTLFEEMQLSEILRQGIEKLPNRKRNLQNENGRSISNQEIADRMGIFIHTVKSHYQEAIKMLRDYFAR